MEIRFTTAGSVRGTCRHRHETLDEARACLAEDRSGCRKQGGYSDRAIVVIRPKDYRYPEGIPVGRDWWLPESFFQRAEGAYPHSSSEKETTEWTADELMQCIKAEFADPAHIGRIYAWMQRHWNPNCGYTPDSPKPEPDTNQLELNDN